jgi:hypothetical protein
MVLTPFAVCDLLQGSCPPLGCSYVLDRRRAVVQVLVHNMYRIPIESRIGGASNIHIVTKHCATHAGKEIIRLEQDCRTRERVELSTISRIKVPKPKLPPVPRAR